MEFPFLASLTSLRVLTHLANILMWKASLRGRKLRIRTRIRFFLFRNGFAAPNAFWCAKLRLMVDARYLIPS